MEGRCKNVVRKKIFCTYGIGLVSFVLWGDLTFVGIEKVAEMSR